MGPDVLLILNVLVLHEHKTPPKATPAGKRRTLVPLKSATVWWPLASWQGLERMTTAGAGGGSKSMDAKQPRLENVYGSVVTEFNATSQNY